MPTQKRRIVPVGEAQIDQLVHIIRESFADVARRFDLTPQNCPKHPSNCTRDWIERDLTRRVRYFFLTIDDQAVGCVGVETASPETCYLERLAVLPDHRGQGSGTRLVHHALDVARTMGARRVEIGIIAADTQLRRFYENIGFEPGATKNFAHLPFEVAFMGILV